MDLDLSIRKKGKLGRCSGGLHHALVQDAHSVIVFWVPEHKDRRRLIPQPAHDGVCVCVPLWALGTSAPSSLFVMSASLFTQRCTLTVFPRQEQPRLLRTIFCSEPASSCGMVYVHVFLLATLVDRHVHRRYVEDVPWTRNADDELARSLLTSS